jgi:hypothetical protein
MTDTTLERRPGAGDMLLGAGLLAASTLAAAMIGRTLGSSTREGALGAAVALAIGTLAIAWWVARRTRYPRWSVYGAGAVLASGTLLSALGASDPGAWSESNKLLGWILQYSLLTLGMVPSRATSGVCAATHPRAGWILMVGSVLLTVLWWFAGEFPRR